MLEVNLGLEVLNELLFGHRFEEVMGQSFFSSYSVSRVQCNEFRKEIKSQWVINLREDFC